MTQEELGEQCELTASYVARVERGERLPSLVVLDRLAQAVDLDVGDIWPSHPRRNPGPKQPSARQAAVARLLKVTEELSPADLRQLTTLIQRLLKAGRE